MSITADGIVDLAVAIELECAALYECYARCFSSDEEVVWFWRLYAEAERYHAASIRIHQASFAPEGEPVESEVDLSDAEAFLAELRELRATAEKGGLTISAALATARDVEENSAELHGRTQFFRGHPHLAELFERMAEEDRAHRDVLTSAERRFGERS